MTNHAKAAAKKRPMGGSALRSPDERSEAGRSSVDSTNGRAPREVAVTNETVERPRRRTFTAEYKLGVLREADAASESGAIGALLRREGLYSSHLATWRRERDAGALAGLSKRRGPQARRLSAEEKRVAQLERENERLRHRLKQAEAIIELQEKLHDLMGIEPGSPQQTEISP